MSSNFYRNSVIRLQARQLLQHAIAWGMLLNSSVLIAQAPLKRAESMDRVASRQVVETLPLMPGIAADPGASVAPMPPLPAASEQRAIPPAISAMSMADFENLALANNPSLAESVARVNALRGKWEQVGLAPNPYAGYSDQQLGAPTADQRGVVFGQEIIVGKKLQLNRAVVSQEVRRAQQELAAQQLRVLTDTRIAFFTAIAAQQRSVIAKEISDSLVGAVSITQKRFDAKEVGKSDLLQARIEFETAQILQRRSQNQYLEAWRKLAAVTGVQSLEPQPLLGKLSEQVPDYQWEATLQRLIGASPEIAAAQAEIQRTRWAYQRAQAEKKSNVSFQGIVQDDRAVDAIDGAIQLTMPLQIWNRNQGGITQASHDALVAARALEKLELDLQQRLAVVFQRYQSARAQVERYSQSILPDSRETVALVRKTYAAGEYDFLQMLLAQRTYSQTELAYLDALLELHSAALEMEGMLLSNSLQASK